MSSPQKSPFREPSGRSQGSAPGSSILKEATSTTVKSSPNVAHQGTDGIADTRIGASIADRSSQILTLPKEILFEILGSLYNKDLVEQRGYLASRVAKQLVDPRLQTYTHNLEILLREPSSSRLDDPDRFVSQALSTDVRPLWGEEFGLERRQVWEDEVKRPNIDSVLGFFLCILKNVKRLTIYLDGIQRPFLLGILEPFTEEGDGALSALESLHVDGFTIDYSLLPYQVLELGAQIPSVTELKASNVILDGLEQYPVSSPFVSNVESFKLEHCCLGSHHMVAMVSSMQALKHFSHKECRPGSQPYQTTLVDSLKCVARRTLISFELIDQAPWAFKDGLPLDSLEDFETLRKITLDFDNLFTMLAGQTSISWRTRLPKSIQRLKLVRKSWWVGSRCVQTVLKALLRKKWECWPDLEEFILIGPRAETADDLKVARVARRLGHVGVRVTLKYSEKDFQYWTDEDEQIDYGSEEAEEEDW